MATLGPGLFPQVRVTPAVIPPLNVPQPDGLALLVLNTASSMRSWPAGVVSAVAVSVVGGGAAVVIPVEVLYPSPSTKVIGLLVLTPLNELMVTTDFAPALVVTV